jgi:hypothetical protein
MFNLKESIQKILLSEALSLELARKYTSIKRNPAINARLNMIFSELLKLPNAFGSKRNERIYVPLKKEKKKIWSPVASEIEREVSKQGYKISDYKAGLLSKGNRQLRISKALTALGLENLKKKFEEDLARAGTREEGKLIVFSRHAYDIAAMSTRRGWTSCMNLYTGIERDHVQYDIKEGSIIAYLILKEDTNLRSPIGRVLIKPFIDIKNKTNVLYVPEKKIYPTTLPDEFLEQVEEIFSKIQKENVEYGVFKLVNTLYCDSQSIILRSPPHIQAILDGKKEAQTKEEVKEVLQYLEIKDYQINNDLSVNVNYSVNISNKDLKVIPIKFNKVYGSFYCKHNNLTSLEGAPKEIGGVKKNGDFYCSYNKLTSLKGFPKEINGTVRILYNSRKFTEEEIRAISNVGGYIYV